MKSKVLLFVLILLSITSLGITYPKWPEIQSPPGGQWVYDTASGVWRPMAGDALGVPSSNATMNATMTMPSVGLATTSYVVLATNAVTLFQNVASFTSGDLVMFQGRGKFYWAPTSGTSETAAGLQSTGYVADAEASPIQINLNTTSNLAFVADPASIATLTYTLIRLQ